MPDKKLTDLTVNNTPAIDDLIYTVDVSETVAANKSKSLTYGQLKPYYDVRDFGASRTGTPAANKTAIQACIDAASLVGAIVLVTESYPCASGLILKRNVVLQGNSPQSFKSPFPYGSSAGSASVPLKAPAGGAFVITDNEGVTALGSAFLLLESNVCIDGISFVYPNNDMNTSTPATSIIKYPPTIAASQSGYLSNVRLTNLNFTGAWICIDLTIVNEQTTKGCQDLYFDTIYGYPFSGRFIKINNCFDVPRISRCHVNPSSGMNLYWDQVFPSPSKNPALDFVVKNGEPTFQFNGVQQFGVRECFVYAVNTGFYVEGGAPGTWGSFVDCNIDLALKGFYFKNINSNVTQIAITNLMGWMSAGIPGSARDLITIENCPDAYFKIVNAHGATGINPEVDTSSNQKANSFLKILGTAPHVMLANCSTAGQWEKAIDAPASSRIKDYGNVWNGTTTIQQSTLDIDPLSLVVSKIELKDAAISSAIGTVPSPTRRIKIKVAGVFYDFLAVESAVSSNPYFNIGWAYEFDARNINAANDVSNGNVIQIKNSIDESQVLTQLDDTKRFAYVASALDGQPVLRTASGNAFLSNTSISYSSPYTILIAVKPSALTNGATDVPFMGNDSNILPMTYFTPTEIGVYIGTSNTNLVRTGTYSAASPYVFVIVVNGSSSKVYYNGTTTTGTLTMSSALGLVVGSINRGSFVGRTLLGDYYKVLFANSELTKTQINNTVAQMKTERPSLPWTDLS